MVVFPTPGPPVMTRTFAGFLFDPGQRFLGVDAGPGQRLVGQTQYPLGNDLLGPVQPTEKDAACLANRVRDDRALGQFKVQRR